MSTTISILRGFTPQFGCVASIPMKSLIWRSLVLILGRSGLIHLSAATCLCILSVHLLKQLRLEQPFLVTYKSSLPSGKELLEFRGLLDAVRANLAHGIVSRGIRERETAMFIPVFFLIWINGPPSCKQCHLETQEWLYGLCSCREHGKPPCQQAGIQPTRNNVLEHMLWPGRELPARPRAAGVNQNGHYTRSAPVGAGTELAGSPLTPLQEAAASGKYCVTVKLLFSLHVLPGTLKV